jgi:DNA-binding transcriptional ArsR family regulator
MLRIAFNADDVARTKIAAAPDPLWELVLSLHMLRGQRGDLLFGPWRRSTAAAVRRAGLGARMRVLNALTPTFGYFPDFLNPAAALSGLEHGLEAIRSTPKAALRRDLSRLAVPRGAAPALGSTALGPPALGPLARGDVAELTALTDTMRAYHEIAIEPHRDAVAAAVEHDRALRMHAMLSGGVEGLLGSMRGMLSWSAGELRVASHPDQEIRLGGRGLVLIPSYFVLHHPLTLFDDSLPPVLVYPIERVPTTMDGPGCDTRRCLAALIGQTRAAVLQAATMNCTTSELARRVGVSTASASQHAAVLRDAGLITSHRDRNRMMHRVTRLGLAMLNGG